MRYPLMAQESAWSPMGSESCLQPLAGKVPVVGKTGMPNRYFAP